MCKIFINILRLTSKRTVAAGQINPADLSTAKELWRGKELFNGLASRSVPCPDLGVCNKADHRMAIYDLHRFAIVLYEFIEWASAQVPPTSLYLGGTVGRERERDREGEGEGEGEMDGWMDR